MKKVFILLSMFFAVFLAACDNKKAEETPPTTKEYTVKMIYDESLPISTSFLFTTEENTTITKDLLSSFIGNVDYYEIDNFYNDLNYSNLTTFPFVLKNDVDLYVKFKEKGQFYDIMFNSRGGNEIPSARVPANTDLYNLPIPKRENYDFIGWYTDSKTTNEFVDNTKITDNITLYAKWEKSTYTLTYFVEGEEKSMEVKRNTKLEDITLPINEGYSFVGWYTDSKCNEAAPTDFVMNKNTIFYTKWEVQKFDVLFKYGDQTLTSQRLETGEYITKPTQKFDVNLVFHGWYSDANLTTPFDFNTPVTKDTTIYAKYNDVANVNFYNGRTDELLDNKTINYNSEVSSIIFNPTKDGYRFDGWFTDKYFRNALNNTTKVTENMSLYAKFTKQNSNLNEAYVYQSSAGGVVEGKIIDFNQYLNSDAYIQVSNAKDFLDALKLAKYEYTNDSVTNGVVNQTLVKEGTIHVIEITNDLDLGYNVLKNSNCDMSLVTDHANFGTYYGSAVDLNSRMYVYDKIYESGISQINIANMYNLLIFSKNNSKITHAGFKVNCSNNVVFRNLTMDEIWVWEDSPSINTTKKIGDYDVWGWAYFKINFSESIWIDNCTFGKSFDGQIDVANPTFNTLSTYKNCPYLPTYDSGVHISNCDFNAGSDDSNGYLVKMMEAIEAEYQLYLNDKSRVNNNTCMYYFSLRDLGASKEDILYGLAIPQKKGFLLGDTGNSAGTKVKTEDVRFKEDKKYYKVTGFEANGREKVGNTVAEVKAGALIADAYYEVAGRTINSYYEQQTPGPDYFNNQNLRVSFSNCRFTGIEDRLPNCRGGIVYFYNCIVDTTSYVTSRVNLLKYQEDIVKKSSKYKLALVSQAIITCLGGDVYSDTVIYNNFAGNDLVKNNNSVFSSDNAKYDQSGYSLQNCWLLEYNKQAKYGSMSYDGQTNPFGTVNVPNASITNFSFRNDNNEVPFYLYRGVEFNQTNSENACQLLNEFITNSRSYLKTRDNYWLTSSYTNLL